MNKELIERLALVEADKYGFAGRMDRALMMLNFLAAVDAERGKEAIATKIETSQFNCFQVTSEDAKKLAALPAGTKIFLSPQPAIPEGMALDDETRWILGRPNFACAGIASKLREHGHKIECRSEDEQASVLHWMLGFYAKYGVAWRHEAEAYLNQPTAVAGVAP